MTSRSAWTSESKLKARSIERSSTIASDVPSFTCAVMCVSAAKRSLQRAMAFSAMSTITSSEQRSRRKCVQRPKPGAISRMRPVGT